MTSHWNGRSTEAPPAEIDTVRAAASAFLLAEAKRSRALELRQEAADLIDASAGIDTTLPPEHRVRELSILQAGFSDLLERRDGRPLTAPEQAQLDAVRAVFDGAKAIRAAEAVARAEVAAAKDHAALRGVLGVAARLS